MIKLRLIILFNVLFLSTVSFAQALRSDNDVEPFVGSSCTLHEEPNVELAKSWWPDQRNIWTPIGWKDHYFRFNVLYNGNVLVEPAPHWAPMRKHSKKYLGQDFMLSFYPLPSGTPPPLPKEVTSLWRIDGGRGIQGWRKDKETPVLYTDFPLQEGIVVRKEIFANVKGSKDVETGIEPLYAWIRLSVTNVDTSRFKGVIPVATQLSRVYYIHSQRYLQEDGITIDINPKLAPYPKELSLANFTENGQQGYRLLEPDGKVRLVILPTEQSRNITLSPIDSGMYNLRIDLNAKVGDKVDVLVPMLPEELTEVNTQQALGFDGALTNTEPYWQHRPKSAANIHVPEEYINRWLAHSIKFAEIIAEKDYVNGEYTFLSGSWGYDNLWSTPTSMTSHMFLSLLGYHESVGRHLELFRENQGTVKPPGAAYELHPGYYSTPKTLTAFDWLTDHGAILHQASTHAMLSKDPVFIANWTESIVKACDFIKDMSAKTNFEGIKGLLPPAVATDELMEVQAVWNVAWNYKGLHSAVEFLQSINHPRAADLLAFKKKFKETFITAYRKLAAEGPTWTDRDGNKRPKPPTNLTLEPMPFHRFSDAFYLDGGPMVLVWAGLMDANDPIMRSVVDFFRHGPNRDFYGTRFNPLSRPYLNREISTCEPCYSWNVFHSWQLHDRKHFLEGLYSLLVGATSQQTYISCEHRHGIQGTLFATPLAFNLMRLAMIDDEIEENAIHLLRICPDAWISSKEETVFENMPTKYGVADLRVNKSEDGKTLFVTINGKWTKKPEKLKVHVPLKGVTRVVINGKRYKPADIIDI
ncbi:hypothetical protein [Sphingobacterium chuzhouense]|uniref:Uncharacterized protein n=1 Tax=Sphingobacterium chuzhouense TaxID=1742264 RepID=A0ABR7XRH7_9SPHI|nr:hypothetical protein [Sphingobacterium chuzhouense]MBD1420887.1 hypothetical protein [Sphingobacterium chuzhouense]